MKPHNKVIIRTDASTRIGSGHVMRCLTLAEELRDADVEVSFISRAHPGNLNDLIKGKGFHCHELPESPDVESNEQNIQGPRSEYASWLGVSQERDAMETIKAVGDGRAEWLIIDHYGLDEKWEMLLRPHVGKIMIIDDLADRHHDCDLLLDQNLFLNGENRYDELVSPACTKLLGPTYALIRKEFREARKNLRERSGKVKRLLVFMGGADPENITGLAIEALSAPELLHLEVDVVIGAQNPNRVAVEKLVQERPRTTLHVQVTNIAELMNRADLAIGAGGSTTWERLYLGLPCIVIPIAKNQILPTKDLCNLGLIISLGGACKLSGNHIKKILINTINNDLDLIDMSKSGIKLVSCNGIKDLKELLAGNSKEDKITYRKATPADCRLYWYWANDPEVRNNAFNTKKISWEEHQTWFASKLKDPLCDLLIFESQYGPIGQIRLDGDKSKKTISYSVAAQYRGKGIGKKMILEIISARPSFAKIFLAEVKKDNRISSNIFEKIGFRKTVISAKNSYSYTLDIGHTYQAA